MYYDHFVRAQKRNSSTTIKNKITFYSFRQLDTEMMCMAKKNLNGIIKSN